MHTVDIDTPRLLAIDDDPSCAELIARVARRCGYQARAMVETRMLVDTMGQWRPHVVALDLRMPRVSGSDVISLLKIINYPGALIIVSGLGPTLVEDARLRAEFGQLNVAATMRKPIDIEALRQLLERLAARPADPGAVSLAG